MIKGTDTKQQIQEQRRIEKAFVTGAGGFIGSNLVEALVRNGATVRALVHYRGIDDLQNLKHLEPDVLAAIEIIKGDVRDPHLISNATRGCDTVFHLAALPGVPYSFHAPASYLETNAGGALNLLESCRRNNVERFVHTSSSEVYGTARYVPIDEGHPLLAQSPYAASKIAADAVVESYHRSYGLPTVTIRPFNAFGPRQSTRAIIPTIIAQLLAETSTIRLGALAPKRDFTFVSDVVSGFIAAAECQGVEGETMNLGSGKTIAIAELASRIMALTGRSAKIEVDPERIRPERSEVLELMCDASLASARLGWKPVVSLDEGLRRTADFLQMNPNTASHDRYGI